MEYCGSYWECWGCGESALSNQHLGTTRIGDSVAVGVMSSALLLSSYHIYLNSMGVTPIGKTVKKWLKQFELVVGVCQWGSPIACWWK